MTKFFLFVNTIRYLKFVQLVYRAYYKIIPVSYLIPKKTNHPNREQGKAIIEPCRKKSYYHNDKIHLLNNNISIPDGVWDDRNYSKLENYNLNYFDYIFNTGNLEKSKSLIKEWTEKNKDYNTIPWHAYPVSLRIVNWIKFLSFHNIDINKYDQEISKHAAWLLNNLEYHLLGNHLLVNAKALLYAGFYLSSKESEVYIEKGLKLFEKELKEQLLDDGGSFELSPMYHAIMLEDLLDLHNIITASPKHPESRPLLTTLENAMTKMFDWLNTMTHSSGKYAHFNDSSGGVAPTLDELKKYADRLDLSHIYIKKHIKQSRYLRSSGYCRLENEQAYVICDGANVGPDYIPGHAHADTLSFELTINNTEVIVNSGISEYGVSDERHRQRSTAAHSTASINNENSSEVWAGFRVARRAKIVSERFEKDTLSYCAIHDGYKRLPCCVTHKRTWALNGSSLKVSDDFTGKDDASVEVYFHLHPDISIEKCDSNYIILKNHNHLICKLHYKKNLDILINDSTYHPNFGETVKNKVIIFKAKTSFPSNFDFSFVWK